MDDREIRARCQIDWLSKASPDDWHRAALDFEWHQPLEPLLWIVSQPDCDKATALAIFWKAKPQNFLRLILDEELSEDAMPCWELAQFIAQRINDQSFANANIAFDADEYIERDYDELADLERQLGNSPLKAHPDMKLSIAGRKIEADGAFAKLSAPTELEAHAPKPEVSEPAESQATSLDDDASARVRAVRRQAEADSESVSPNGDARSLLQRLKGLFGR